MQASSGNLGPNCRACKAPRVRHSLRVRSSPMVTVLRAVCLHACGIAGADLSEGSGQPPRRGAVAACKCHRTDGERSQQGGEAASKNSSSESDASWAAAATAPASASTATSYVAKLSAASTATPGSTSKAAPSSFTTSSRVTTPAPPAPPAPTPPSAPPGGAAAAAAAAAAPSETSIASEIGRVLADRSYRTQRHAPSSRSGSSSACCPSTKKASSTIIFLACGMTTPTTPRAIREDPISMSTSV
mmetsp:Transcript_33355/g.87492  ORF Transcript_33355/g.87492 Transcript_33355/m.87492 type:complete len:245 (-) Transcript_33355:761-1495(-)